MREGIGNTLVNFQWKQVQKMLLRGMQPATTTTTDRTLLV